MPIPETYASLLYLHLGANEFLISVIGFAGSIAVALVQFPGGNLANKHGRRWLMFSITFGMTVGSLFFVFAPSWQFILTGILFPNICAIYGPSLMTLIMDSLRARNRGAAFNFQSVITTLVLLPAPIIAQFLVIIFDFDLGMRVAYTIVAVAYFANSIAELKLTDTLPSSAEKVKACSSGILRIYPQSRKKPECVEKIA